MAQADDNDLFGAGSTSEKLFGKAPSGNPVSVTDALFGPGSTSSKAFPKRHIPTPGGSSMDARMIDSLGNVVKSTTPNTNGGKKLDPPQVRGGFPEQRAEGKVQGSTRLGTGGSGLASPLTEGETATTPQTPVLDRTYYDPELATSSDGVFVFEFQQLHQIKMIDANGATTTFIFAQET